jgi:hypothetical protein
VYYPLHLSPILQPYLTFPSFLTGLILFLALGEGKGVLVLHFVLSKLTIHTYLQISLTTCLLHILSDALYFKNKLYHTIKTLKKYWHMERQSKTRGRERGGRD